MPTRGRDALGAAAAVGALIFGWVAFAVGLVAVGVCLTVATCASGLRRTISRLLG